MTITYTTFRGSKAGEVVKKVITRPDLGPDEVLLENLYSGLCGTDAHYLHEDITLGHEGVGVVKQIGVNVKAVKVGDRVGVGYVRDGCGHCKYCLRGYAFFCETKPDNYSYQNFDSGAFSSHSIYSQTRLVKIPDEIPSEYAGPLMCAGQTVFIPFYRNNIRPWDTVGIVGIGGLGHLAIQFAAKMGCRVAVFSTSESKRKEAMELGATEFYTTAQLKEEGMKSRFVDHLLVATSVLPDWSIYEPLMAFQSNIYPLTISSEDFTINAFSLVVHEITVHGMCSATMPQLNAMVDFAARHKIRPVIEEFPMTVEGINAGFEKLAKGQVRYRAVLKVSQDEA